MLQSARTEAKELDVAMVETINAHGHCFSVNQRKHAKLLHEEYRRLAELRKMKETQMIRLDRALTSIAIQQASL